MSRRRAPARSQSLLFAALVVLGAAAGLALVWRQAWMPSLPRVTVSVARQQEQHPPNAVNPSQAPAAAPVETAVGGADAALRAAPPSRPRRPLPCRR